MQLERFYLPDNMIKTLQSVADYGGCFRVCLGKGKVAVDVLVGNVRMMFDYPDSTVRNWQVIGVGFDRLKDIRVMDNKPVEFVYDHSTRFLFANGTNLNRCHEMPYMAEIEEEIENQQKNSYETIGYEIVGKILSSFGVYNFRVKDWSEHYGLVEHPPVGFNMSLYILNI